MANKCYLYFFRVSSKFFLCQKTATFYKNKMRAGVTGRPSFLFWSKMRGFKDLRGVIYCIFEINEGYQSLSGYTPPHPLPPLDVNAGILCFICRIKDFSNFPTRSWEVQVKFYHGNHFSMKLRFRHPGWMHVFI